LTGYNLVVRALKSTGFAMMRFSTENVDSFAKTPNRWKNPALTLSPKGVMSPETGFLRVNQCSRTSAIDHRSLCGRHESVLSGRLIEYGHALF